jgi:hypothetical protein
VLGTGCSLLCARAWCRVHMVAADSQDFVDRGYQFPSEEKWPLQQLVLIPCRSRGATTDANRWGGSIAA